MSPISSGLPSLNQIFVVDGNFASFARLPLRPRASASVIGNPCSAISMAGAKTSASGLVPYFCTANAAPPTAPGTAIVSGPSSGIPPLLLYSSIVAACGAKPVPLMNFTSRVFAL